jgi:hypothetical protein
MANLYWGGGAGTWDSISTANWYTNAGLTIPAGAAPTLTDDVFFQQAATYSVINSGGRCRNFTVSAGLVTFANSIAPTVAGSLSFTAGTVAAWTSISTLTFNTSTTGNTINTGGVNMVGLFNFIGGGSWTLTSTLSITNALTVTEGSFDTGNYNISIGSLVSLGTATRSITLGTSIVTLTFSGTLFNIASATGLTFSAASSIIQSNDTAGLFTTPGLTFGTVSFTNTGTVANSSITFFGGSNTFGALTFASRTSNPGISILTFPSATTQTVGTLSLNSGTASSYRKFLRASVIGTAVNFAVTTFNSASDIDFRDINATGVAFSGTRFGNCQGNTNISFDAAKTVYYRNTGTNNWGTATNGSWVVPTPLPNATCTGTALVTTTSPTLVVGMTIVSSNGTSLGTITGGSINAWTVSIGGSFTTPQTMLAFAATSDPTMFPLAQDTAVFAAGVFPATGQTTTVNANYNIGTIDMSARTSNTMTLATGTTTPTIYGNWINGTALNNPTGSGIMTFAGRGSQTITSAGKTFTQAFTINTPSGSVTLQDNLILSLSNLTVLIISQGTFDANSFNVTLSGALGGVNSATSTAKTIGIGSGTWFIGGSSTSWSVTGSNVTITGTGTISMTSGSSKIFTGNNFSYAGITLNQGGAGALTITGSNTFGNITNTVQPATITFAANSTQTVSNFSVSGTAGNLVTINSTVAGTRANLSKASGTVNVSFCSIRDSNATGGATWNAYTSNGNVNVSNNLGWIFTAPSGNTSNFFLLF